MTTPMAPVVGVGMDLSKGRNITEQPTKWKNGLRKFYAMAGGEQDFEPGKWFVAMGYPDSFYVNAGVARGEEDPVGGTRLHMYDKGWSAIYKDATGTKWLVRADRYAMDPDTDEQIWEAVVFSLNPPGSDSARWYDQEFQAMGRSAAETNFSVGYDAVEGLDPALSWAEGVILSPTEMLVRARHSARLPSGKGNGGILFITRDMMGPGVPGILLFRRSQKVTNPGQWGIPGGTAKRGETPWETAVRETWEEAGEIAREEALESEGVIKVGTWNGFTTFLVPTYGFTPSLNWEHDAYKWVAPFQARSMDLHKGVKKALEELRKRAQKGRKNPPLPKKLQDAVELLATGLTAKEVALELGVYASQVGKWMNHPAFQEAMEESGMKWTKRFGWVGRDGPPKRVRRSTIRSYEDALESRSNPREKNTIAYLEKRMRELDAERRKLRPGSAKWKEVREEQRIALKRLRKAWKYTPKSIKNPKGSDIYDPREEQLRAQRQAIYETSLSRKFGQPFRDKRGKRLDAKVIEKKGVEWLRPYMQRRMFAMGTGVQQRDGRLKAGTQTPTRKTVLESKKRYADVDKLMRNRQDYEESLGIARKGGFYRVTRDVTKRGLLYSVWPLPPGQRLPKLFTSEKKAAREALNLNADLDPLYTGKWWVPPKKRYTKRELAEWLPSADVWRK